MRKVVEVRHVSFGLSVRMISEFVGASVHTPSPPRIFALMPSAAACLVNGPPVASMPPYMITSG